MATAKRTMVMRLTQKEIPGVNVDGKTFQFGKKTNAFEMVDPGLAREIDARYGPKATGDVVIAPHDVIVESGHRYSFTVPELPWKREKQ